MVIAKADDSKKIRTGNDNTPTGLDDAHEFGNECLRFFDMFENAQSPNAGEEAVRKWKFPPVVELATGTELLSLFNVRFGDIDSMSFKARLGQSPDDMARAASNIKGAPARFGGLEIVRVFGVEVSVPVGQEFGISLTMSIGFLVTHFDGNLEFGVGAAAADDSGGLGATTKIPQRTNPTAMAAKLT